MGLYAKLIFPQLMNLSMDSENLAQYRQDLLAQVSGTVLEIGFGTGLNLAYYPKHIQSLVAIEQNEGMQSLVQKRIQASSIAVDLQFLDVERLPMPDHSFDSVVSTWTLCSVNHIHQALREVHRVLKPQGRFFFIEHGLSSDSSVQAFQRGLNPIQKIVGVGCHLNRNFASLITQYFEPIQLDQFYVQHLPKPIGYMYQGIAQPKLDSPSQTYHPEQSV